MGLKTCAQNRALNEHRRNQGNIIDTQPLGGVNRASGRQGLIVFGKSILSILVHWDGSGVYVCLDEPSKGHPDPAKAIQALGRAQCGLSGALPSTSQLGVHILLILGMVLCMGLCFFLTGLKEEEEK